MINKLHELNKQKKPLSVIVYDQLYKLIMEGIFPPDSQLPTEPELAKKLGVSRMTLRHALALLKEDGLVKNIQGKGNFITKFHQNESMDGLEKLGNPLYKCYTGNIDDIELIFRIDLITDYAIQVLNREMTAVVALERWYKSNDKIVAFAFTMMPIEAVSQLNLDLQNEKQVLDMLEEKVYELANSSTIEIKRSDSVNTPSLKYQLSYGEECDLILESVYISDKYPVVYNKYYIPIQFSQIRIKTSK
ncbi:GntR family transcriptional regulator [Paenibacillus sp. FSL E2-8871]|uniref:Fatty acid metabolism regulator protein n=1 Tax=Paenibacillus pseudetheri TaxID=2897682 RepID=A0ABN8FF11_9BACL|nr:GntR family transcriptional regulator [Paenibacillus pseudetheri]CAH1056635.1 Fatty acid metabolism regulator protein [Paenibacillus pseudetheri]